MSAFFKQRMIRGAHARIAAEDVRTSSKTGLLVLLIIFVALFAMVLRMADFSLHRVRHAPPAPPPAAAVFNLM